MLAAGLSNGRSLPICFVIDIQGLYMSELCSQMKQEYHLEIQWKNKSNNSSTGSNVERDEYYNER